jgi:hypothetical protein
MDIVWSPRKRIKLTVGKPSGTATDDANVTASVKSSPQAQSEHKSMTTRSSSSRRKSSLDFDRELDECLDTKDNSFQPTQVFLVDPEMELAMLQAEMEVSSSLTPPLQEVRVPSVSRTLSRWETAPLEDITRASHQPALKRHSSESIHYPIIAPSTTTQSNLVDELDGIDLCELTAAVELVESTFTADSTPSLGMFSSRCEVLQVPIYSSGSVGMQVREESTNKLRFISLSGVWRECYLDDPWQLEPGDTVHLLGDKSLAWISDHLTIGDSSSLFPSLIIFHPDQVLSSTTLSASATCQRRSVIQNRVLAPQIGPFPTGEADIVRALSPVVGNCIHEALQRAADKDVFSESFLFSAGQDALEECMLPSVWMCGAEPAQVLNELNKRLSSIAEWGRVVWPKMASRLRGCETEIRPKSLGVTGKLDMDIEDLGGARSCIEIKTGKHHAIHVGQVVLYYLLQYVDRYGNPDLEFASQLPGEIATMFSLLYLPPSGPAESISVKITPRECQNIICGRNLIASHTLRKTLPKPILKRGDCQFCPVRKECAAYWMLGADADDPSRELFMSSVQLSEKKSEEYKKVVLGYLNTWMGWIDKQKTSEHGGLSAVRRWRGNVLNMVTHTLASECGSIAEETFLDWIPVLVGQVSSWGNGIAAFLNKKSRKKPLVLAIDTEEPGRSERIVDELILPVLQSRVLLCAPSHESVDQVLVKLVQQLGKTDPDLIQRITRLASRPEDVDETLRTDPTNMMLPSDWINRIDTFSQSRVLYACTAKAVHHDLLCPGDFELAIVVGADKVSDPNLWGVLLRAKKIVLIGSSRQRDEENLDPDASPPYLFARLLESGQGVVKWDSELLDDTQSPVFI